MESERVDPEAVEARPIEIVTATPELFAALAKAQEQAKTVTKGGYNQHARYNYATAEDMIAAGRMARRGTGLGLITSWAVELRDDASPLLTLHWLLTHSSGGVLRGSVVAPVQESKRNGGDKQSAALATYLEGFIERGLMRLDREGTPPEEDRDSHDDREGARHEPPQAPPKRERHQHVTECATAEELHAWCERYGAAVRKHCRESAVVEHGETIGVGADDVMRWLGAEAA